MIYCKLLIYYSWVDEPPVQVDRWAGSNIEYPWCTVKLFWCIMLNPGYQQLNTSTLQVPQLGQSDFNKERLGKQLQIIFPQYFRAARQSLALHCGGIVRLLAFGFPQPLWLPLLLEMHHLLEWRCRSRTVFTTCLKHFFFFLKWNYELKNWYYIGQQSIAL